MKTNIQCVPLATEPGISLIILPLMRILQLLQAHTTDTFLFISHTTNVNMFKFRCDIFIGVTIIKEMLGSLASGTHCIFLIISRSVLPRTRNVSDESCRENKSKHFMFNNFFF